MKILFLVFFALTTPLLPAQDITFTKSSAKLFTNEEMRQMIREAAFERVKEYHVPRSIFDSKYAMLENQFLAAARPKIVKAFTRAEKTGAGNGKEQMIADYKLEVKIVAADEVMRNRTFQDLVVVDQTDRILKFFSDIKIKKSGLIQVTEHITIYNGNGEQSWSYSHVFPEAERNVNNDIQHGLIRDFPTIYEDKQGFRVKMPFRVKSIYRNGKEEEYISKNLDNGLRLLLGSASVYLPEGVYEYIISYETSNQLVFHADKDELYWNVNGTGWVFTSDSVSSKITFPADAKIFENACYTGAQGSTERICIGRLLNDSTIFFATTQQLNAYEGLTIAAAIQKNVLASPTSTEKFINFLTANWPIPSIFLVLLLIFLINLRNWMKFGKDPAQGTIIPRFEPPGDIWAADAGYIYLQKFKPEQFSAALIDLAVKKGITIDVEKDGAIFKSTIYTFKKGSNTKPALKDFAKQAYQWDLERLYGLKATGSYNSSIESLNDQLKSHLESKFRSDSNLNQKKKGLFALNSNAASHGFFYLFVLGFASLFVPSTLSINIVIGTLFAFGFVTQFIFYKIMPAYSKEGRKIMDELLGFRMYLATAEERRFDKLNPPEKNIELFEKFLPYAIALECQNEWANKFEEILKVAIANNSYHPTNYSGDMSRDMSFSSISDGISSGLSSTVASASTAPSSDSDSGGSSGGGSSGELGQGKEAVRPAGRVLPADGERPPRDRPRRAPADGAAQRLHRLLHQGHATARGVADPLPEVGDLRHAALREAVPA